jgi:DNA ligase-1
MIMLATWPKPSRWPGLKRPRLQARNDAPGLTEVVETLIASSRAKGPALIEDWLDRLDAPGRYALLKLVTGGFRMGISGRLIKQALAGFGGVNVNEIEELWHGWRRPISSFLPGSKAPATSRSMPPPPRSAR